VDEDVQNDENGPLNNHFKFKPKKLLLNDWIRGENSDAKI